MPQPQYHFFICTNQRPPGHPKGSCGSLGAGETFQRLFEHLDQQNLWGKMKVTPTGCMGPCMAGPIMVCYPEGTWYKAVTAKDVDEIIESHVKNGTPVERLRLDPEMIG
ncbi:MAG: ferredoxin [Candidatus Lambdaproteobacteria bacterium RIFOXYD2_FULL_50_16]|uniref:Ferredoxin n=1 Tax=Candidatus Lambdaproteobacteria bacterium RIFOXYD2_FULL_50_16 TaxID=1817772 RepID=A0A1F6GEX3_9PROT|nr:MAG: ferredoxin [Candidatus Lambdaproteobacteria bacterium RIFOXYD2_FULL_50_16]